MLIICKLLLLNPKSKHGQLLKHFELTFFLLIIFHIKMSNTWVFLERSPAPIFRDENLNNNLYKGFYDLKSTF